MNNIFDAILWIKVNQNNGIDVYHYEWYSTQQNIYKSSNNWHAINL